MLSRLLRSLTNWKPSSPAMSNAPNPLPTYLYKILETAKTNPRYLFPVPIPSSHLFTLPPLDEKDGYVHMSTTTQLPGTLNRFFGDHDEVVLLKMDYRRLSSWKDVRWEQTSSGVAFPHLYGYGIEGDMVESFKEVRKPTDGEKTSAWADALEELKKEGWLIY